MSTWTFLYYEGHGKDHMSPKVDNSNDHVLMVKLYRGFGNELGRRHSSHTFTVGRGSEESYGVDSTSIVLTPLVRV